MTFTRNDTKVIKGMAIIFMLYHHLFYFPDRIAEAIEYIPLLSYHGTSVAYYIGEFGKLCVALFLFLGGYGTYYSCRKHTGDTKAVTRLALQKTKNLYMEYWKVFVIFVPICIYAGVERVDPDLKTMIWNFVGLSDSYCGEWWFFPVYVVLLLTYPIGHGLLSKKRSISKDILVVLLLNLFASYIIPNLYGYDWAKTLRKSMFWNTFSETLVYAPTFYMGCIFAKYDLLTAAKQRFASGIKYWVLACVAFLAAVILRHKEWITYDFILAPIVTLSTIVILNGKLFRPVYWVLEKIGREGTIIWLVHSIYCYLLCQELVFRPRYTLLIFLWLLLMSYATSVAIRKLSEGYGFVKKKVRKLGRK